MKKEHLPQALTAEELAEYLSLHPKTVYRMAREGRIPCIRLPGTTANKGGRGVRFLASDIAAWLQLLST